MEIEGDEWDASTDERWEEASDEVNEEWEFQQKKYVELWMLNQASKNKSMF